MLQLEESENGRPSQEDAESDTNTPRESEEVDDSDIQIIETVTKIIPIIEILDENERDNETVIEGVKADSIAKNCERNAFNSAENNVMTLEEKLLDDGDDVESESKGLKKLPVVLYHGDHKITIAMKKLLCLDCNTRICPVCKYNFQTHLKNHMYYDDCSSHLCSTCGVSFRTPCALKAHQNLHNDIFPLVCPDCGAMYKQANHFVNHSVEHCYHLFHEARYKCTACDVSLESVARIREHTKEHVVTNLQCRLCLVNLGAVRKDALAHLKKEHGIRLPLKSLTFCLDAKTFCRICRKTVPHDHIERHLVTSPVTIFVCPCKKEFTTFSNFRTHRNSCENAKNVPDNRKHEFFRSQRKNREDTKYGKCIKCRKRGHILPSKICELCSINRWLFTKCMQCEKSFKARKGDVICASCSLKDLPSSICATCALEFEPQRGQNECSACLEKRASEPSWLAGEQIINDGIDSFDTCELNYDNHPKDHTYCIRHDFTSKVIADKLRDYKGFKEKIQEKFNNKVQCGRSAEGGSSLLKCSMCQMEFRQPGNLFFQLLMHLEKKHYNAVLPTLVPADFSHIEKDELDLMSRLRIEQNDCDQVMDPTIGVKVDKPRKRMRLYDPNEKKKKGNESEKENSLGTENRSDEVQVSTPPKKDHEFWDEVYEALSAVEYRNVPKVQKERVAETFSGYSSKRQVKKPIRLVEQEENKQQSLSRKARRDSDADFASLERAKIKDASKKSSPSAAVNDSNVTIEKKRKRVSEDIDVEVIKVKNKLRKDDELGFLAKTFQDDTNHSPNKRKRKLASRLVYNNVIDVVKEDVDVVGNSSDEGEESVNSELPEHVCDVCHVGFFKKDAFTQHLLTHRVKEKTLICMECGECFFVLPMLINHLRTVHEVADAEEYVAEYKKGIAHVNELESEEDGHKCKVCLQVFTSALDLNKHFRIHGMAFLKENQKDNKVT